MHVTIDARMVLHGGIGRYIRSLSETLLKQSPTLRLSLLIDPATADAMRRTLGSAELIPFPASIYGIKEQLYGLRLYGAQARRTTLFHVPHYNVPWLLPRNSVVTIHDLTHFQFAPDFGRRRVWLAFRLLQRAVRRAEHLIVVSDATRRALETMFPEARDKTTVVHHGVADDFRPLPAEIRETFRRTQRLGRFLLYVGSTRPHKNLPRLLQAFARVRTQFPQVTLVLLGIEPSSPLDHMDGVRLQGHACEAQLVQWYNAAEALVFPSLNEGFGLPILEAMACGTPVITSNVASLPEVAGDASLLIDPWDTEALAEAIRRLLGDRSLRNVLRDKGLKRAKGFTWASAAEQTLRIYRQVADREKSQPLPTDQINH